MLNINGITVRLGGRMILDRATAAIPPGARVGLIGRSDTGGLSNWLGTASGGFTPNDANAFASVPTNWHVQPEPFLL